MFSMIFRTIIKQGLIFPRGKIVIQHGNKGMDENKNRTGGSFGKYAELELPIYWHIAMIRNFEFHFILISFLSAKMANFRASCRDPTGRNPANVSSSGIFRYSLFRLVAEKRKEIKR